MKKSGFTLVEMLVVIAIIGILAGMLVPLATRGGEGAKKKKAEMEANSLVVAVGQFHDDHHYMPTKDDAKLGKDQCFETNDKGWLEVMQGTNAMAKNYLQARLNQDDVLLDPWGQPYRVAMDRNLDGRVEYDGRKAMETVVAISGGPDKEFGTEDDIATAEWK